MADSEIVLFTVHRSSAVLPISKTFIETHLNNSVFPRLLGNTVGDGLGTSELQHKRDAMGHRTILADLHIEHLDMLHLMQWLRTGHLPYTYQQRAYETSIKLGGIEVIDRYIACEHKKVTAAHEPTKHSTNPPMTPREDALSEFSWTCVNPNHIDTMTRLLDNGWSATINCPDGHYLFYFCRPKTAHRETDHTQNAGQDD